MPVQVCQYCRKEFYISLSHFKRRKYCSWKCRKTSWNSITKKCPICGKKFKVQQNQIRENKGKYCSRKCYEKDMKGRHYSPRTEFKKGHIPWWSKGKKFPERYSENHPNWKGEKAKYISIHEWVFHHKGYPQICMFCGATPKQRKLSWINLDHTYHRNLDDYISACYSCHRKHDYKYNLKPNNRIGTNQFKEHNYKSQQ